MADKKIDSIGELFKEDNLKEMNRVAEVLSLISKCNKGEMDFFVKLFYAESEKYIHTSSQYWNFLRAGNFIETINQTRQDYTKIHDCIKRNHIGFGGERSIDTVIKIIDLIS